MYSRFFRLATLVPLVLVVPSLLVTIWRAGADTDPKLVGAMAVIAVVALVLAVLAWVGRRMPGVSLSAMAAGGVMTYAVAWLFDGGAELALNAAALCMFALCLWAAVTKIDRLRDQNVSHFSR